MPDVDYLTQAELWCLMSHWCAAVKDERPDSKPMQW